MEIIRELEIANQLEDFYKEEKVSVPDGDEDVILIAKYSPNGKYLALLTPTKHIYILETFTNQSLYLVNCEFYNEVRDIEFSKDSSIIGVAAGDGMQLFSFPHGHHFRSIRPDELEPQDYFIRLFFGHPNVLIGSPKINPFIFIYSDYTNSDTEYIPMRYLPHISIISSLNYISHKFIISSYADGMCVYWNPTFTADSYPRKTFPTYPDNSPIPLSKITHTDVTPDNRYLLLTHACSVITSYAIDAIQGEITYLNIYEDHTGNLEGEFEMKGKFMFHKEERFVICGSETCYIYIWNFLTADTLKILNCRGEMPVSIIFSPLEELERFAVLQRNGELIIWQRRRLFL